MSLFHLVWEILNVFMHYLLDKKLSFLVMDLVDLLRLLLIMAWISATNLKVLLISEQSEWGNLSCCIFVINISIPLCCSDSEIFVLKLLVWMLSGTACCFQIFGGLNCIMVLPSSDIVQLTIICCTIDKAWNKVYAQNR